MQDNDVAKKNSQFREIMKRLAKNRLAVAGLVVIILLIILAFLAPVISPYPYEEAHLTDKLQKPSAAYIFGTDELGRDIFSRIIYGGRVSLSVGFIAASISALIGVPLGLIAGFYDNGVRGVIMRIVDIFMSFPALVIQMVLVTVLGASARSLMLVLGFLGWTGYTRLVYSKVLSVKQEVYVEAARSTGATNLTQMVRYILPNAMAPVFVTR